MQYPSTLLDLLHRGHTNRTILAHSPHLTRAMMPFSLLTLALLSSAVAYPFHPGSCSGPSPIVHGPPTLAGSTFNFTVEGGGGLLAPQGKTVVVLKSTHGEEFRGFLILVRAEHNLQRFLTRAQNTTVALSSPSTGAPYSNCGLGHTDPFLKSNVTFLAEPVDGKVPTFIACAPHFRVLLVFFRT